MEKKENRRSREGITETQGKTLGTREHNDGNASCYRTCREWLVIRERMHAK